ncbi:hypothetical protein Tsubulata_002753 [Turnera subulata]|uniref:60S ribosomal protein L37a n=1 Tax=Turnera subulata TaxID=218843 RepID=A0A9Q0GFW4_9ROSI|nr:hypothetical protein Tsubulata_002753 [Turnera subulata]
MTKKTNKAGIFGKYGTHYGGCLRKYTNKIEVSQHKYLCEFCGKYAVKRNGVGIWGSKVCGKVKGGFASNLANQEESGLSRQPKDRASTSHAPTYSAAAAAASQESLNAASAAVNLAFKAVVEFTEAKRLEDEANSAYSSYQTSSIKIFEALSAEDAKFTAANAAFNLQAARAKQAVKAAIDAKAVVDAKAAEADRAAAAEASQVSDAATAVSTAAKEAAQEYLNAVEASLDLATRAVAESTEASRLEDEFTSALASYEDAVKEGREVLIQKGAELEAAEAALHRQAAKAADEAKVVARAKAAEADSVAAAEASQVSDDAAAAVSTAAPALE